MEEAQVGNLEETLREGAPPHLKTLFFYAPPGTCNFFSVNLGYLFFIL